MPPCINPSNNTVSINSRVLYLRRMYLRSAQMGNPSFGTVLKVADAMGYRFALVSKAGKTRGTAAVAARRANASAAKRKPAAPTKIAAPAAIQSGSPSEPHPAATRRQ